VKDIDVWKEVIINAIDYVNVRRHGLYKDEPKALKNLEESVDHFLSETYDGEG